VSDRVSPIIVSPTVDFLMRLKQMDSEQVTTRDVLCLYSIISRPGMTREDLRATLNLNAGVNVLSNINRLIRWGYIEDRRTSARKAIPSILHATKAGIDFWHRIKPKG
jgi:hypothetical protein